jgi:glycosyltransferase involved in cell wall biosynthesis
MKKVLVVQPILSHYRESLFKLLTNDTTIEFKIIAGKELNGVQVFESNTEKIDASLTNKNFKIKGHTFYFQKGIFKEIRTYKPTNIITGGPDFHFISTLVVSFYIVFFTKIKLHFWTHGYSKNNSKLKHKISQFMYKKAASILTYEDEGREYIISNMAIDENKIFVVKNCLNDSDYGFNFNTISNKAETAKLNILFSGRLTKPKRVDLLIQAIEILVRKKIAVNCIIIGDGAYKIELEKLTAKLGLNEYVNFKGALYNKEVQKYFLQSNIFVLPGKVGLSIVHALSYGLPIVTTSLPIHSPEVAILKQDKNAFFFKGDSSENLAETLINCSDLLLKGKNDISKNCVKSITENGYTPENMKRIFFNAIQVEK